MPQSRKRRPKPSKTSPSPEDWVSTRDLAECLILGASDEYSSIGTAAVGLGIGIDVVNVASVLRRSFENQGAHDYNPYRTACLEAGYSVVENSEQLTNEWFG